MDNYSNYDFIDLGTKNGGSMEFALRRLGGVNGLGVDLKYENVIAARKKGYDCIQGDATNLNFPEKSFRFVVMSHFLEHLPDIETVEKVIKNSSRIARDFLFIQGPFFDADEYLKQLGFKLYWSDWKGHPTHLRSVDLNKILKRNGMTKYTIKVRKPILNSLDPLVHPLASPANQHEYKDGKHPGKKYMKFKKPVFREIIYYVPLGKLSNWKKITRARKGTISYFPNSTMGYRFSHLSNEIIKVLNIFKKYRRKKPH